MCITRYDELEIPGARSRGAGRVFSAIDWAHFALEPIGPEILRKAESSSASLNAYDGRLHRALTAVLGRYSAVQSENSEDTVTWSVFGAVDPNPWLPLLLNAAFANRTHTRSWNRRLWDQLPHPQTGGKMGPEADVIFDAADAPDWRYVVEAKWLSDIGKNLGIGDDMTQLDFHAATARATGTPGQCGVLVIAPSPQRYLRTSHPIFSTYFEAVGDGYRALDRAKALEAKAVTWEAIVAMLRAHPDHVRVADYLDWRLRLLDARAP